jgi:nitroimidazol reductase NimA-like FMN-containing flavoprotein (pyridoxamine 5'-phosphate oxidase superfamily)
MFTEMRKKDRQTTSIEVEQILKDGDYGVLSMQGTNGYPYSVPLNYVYKNNFIYFHCAKDGYKINCIENCNNVCFCVVGKSEIISEKFTTDFSSVIVFGKVTEVISEEKIQSLKALIDKYSNDHKPEGYKYIEKALDAVKVLKINIENIQGKSRNKK